MLSYLNLLDDVMMHGKSHADRTGVGTRAVFGRQWRHDMRTGFPLLTTKFIPLRVVFEELRWMLSGSTNIKPLQEARVSIWDEWVDKDGELGPVYGRQFRRQETIRWVEKRWHQKPEHQLIDRVAEPIVASCDKDDPLIGAVVKSSTGDYEILASRRVSRSDENDQTRLTYRVQFANSGYVADGVMPHAAANGQVRDPYFPAFCDVACMGEVNGVSDGEKHPLLETWKGMIKRCYDAGHAAFSKYGGSGVWVCDRWLVFSNFVRDFKLIEGWELKAEYPEEYSIDKDGSGSNVYSVATCAWCSKQEQSVNTSDAEVRIGTSLSGEKVPFINASQFAREHQLVKQSVLNTIRGRQSHHKGWRFDSLTCPDGHVPRYFCTDQLKKLLAQIRHTPESRRLVVSAWNPLETEKMSLAPCHSLFQVKCHDDGYMDLHLYMRSCDIFLGLGFNIPAYGLLLHLLAEVTRRVPGDLIISFGDLHLYNNHVEQAKLQLSRRPFELPELAIADLSGRGSPLETLLSVRWEDISLLNYQHYPRIEASVAV